MPFKKPVQINDWSMNYGVEAQDDANNGEGQIWQFRVSILPTQINLEKALKALNALPIFQEANHPTAKIIQMETTVSWDGTVADASDRDQRGKELCVYLPYDSTTQQFLFGKAYIKNLMLDIWKALQDAEVEVSYITPKQDEKEVSSDPLVLTPFCYSSYKPYSTPEGILHSDTYNPNGHPDPLEGLYFSKRDLLRKGITNFNAPTISEARLQYMRSHNLTTIKGLKATIDGLANTTEPSPYLSLKERIDQAIASNDHEVVRDLLSELRTTYDNFYKRYPSKFNNGGRCPILYDAHMKHLLTNDTTLEEKNQALIQLQKEAAQIIEQLQESLIAQDWPFEKPNEIVIRELARAYPFELQAIQRQLVHLDHEASAIEHEKLRFVDLPNYPAQQAIRAGSIAGAIGFTIGAILGVALVGTGIFAPFGVGVLGMVALAATMGIGAGAVVGGPFGRLVYQNTVKEIEEAFGEAPNTVEDPVLTQGSTTVLSRLSTPPSGVQQLGASEKVVLSDATALNKNSVVAPNVEHLNEAGYQFTP